MTSKSEHHTAAKKSGGVVMKSIIAVIVLVVIILGITFFKYYLSYFGPNVTDKHEYLYIRTGSGFGDVLKTMTDSAILKDEKTFVWAAENMNYKKIRPGRYHLKAGMGNRKLINMLKSGSQEAVTLKFQGKRLKSEFAQLIGSQLETDSAQLLNLLDSSAFVKQYGFTTENVYTMFLPNSYEIYWNTDAADFFKKMNGEYQKFWNAARLEKAKAEGLSPIQVSIMASIVDWEALYDDEMPTIAGLYMNRLKKGIALESDPTVIFANRDFTIRRVLNRHIAVASPYNTYKHTGLPPGPIMMPSIRAIDAVLDYEHNNYLFMCAKEDFSGRHNFAADEAQHKRNAEKYHRALDARNIKN